MNKINMFYPIIIHFEIQMLMFMKRYLTEHRSWFKQSNLRRTPESRLGCNLVWSDIKLIQQICYIASFTHSIATLATANIS